jgi:hypothetical protein
MVGDNRTIDLNTLIINISSEYLWIEKKNDELINFLFPNCPHILCFSEHHLKQFQINQINLDGYKLCAKCQRPSFTPIQNHRQNYSFVYSNYKF